MRTSLRHHLGQAVRDGRIGSLLRGGSRAAALRWGVPLPKRLRGPILVTFAITWRCPLDCAMCDLPSRAGSEIPDDAIPRWIDAICDLGPNGLGFTGGEPLLRTITYDAIERASARGVVTHLNTSGITMTVANAERLASSGVASINVSVDHHDPAEHDRLRRRRGSHAAALRAIEALASARARNGRPFRLHGMMAVSPNSIGDVAPLRRQLLDAGADALSLLPLHDFDSSLLRDEGDPAVVAPFDDLAHIPLENSSEYLAGFAPFFAGEKTPTRCSAKSSALFIDPRGELFACTPASTERYRGIPATPETLRGRFLSGAVAATIPQGRCERCWWNCHRELDIAIGTLPPYRSREER